MKSFLYSFSLLILMLMRSGAAPKPNIVLIVADDLGFCDINSFRESFGSDSVDWGQTKLPLTQTPRLDRMAAEGIMFTQFYANDSVCSPTRAAIMTGKYQHRTGVVNVLGQTRKAYAQAFPDKEPFEGLQLEEFTLAEALKENGYFTAAIGKWHLGPFPKYHPLHQGFTDRNLLFGGASPSYAKATAGRLPRVRVEKLEVDAEV